MSATALPSVPAPAPDDDVPTPRTPWRRWALAVLLAIPAAAAYGVAATAIGRAMFLGGGREAALRDALDGTAPVLLLWVLAAGSSLSGAVLVLREVLDARAARREGRDGGLPVRARQTWAWPAIWAGSPVAAIGLAAGFAAAFQLFQGGERGEAAVVFAFLAGVWLLLVIGLGWVTLVVRSVDDDPHALEGIEATWLQKAAARAFWDVFALLSVACVATAVLGTRTDVSSALAGVLGVALIDFCVRVTLLKRREERAA